MGLFDWLKPAKKEKSSVSGTLEYIPGSTTVGEDTAVVLKDGQLTRRLYVQPNEKLKSDHSNIPIFTGNPFRTMHVAAS